jgi:hypothetical protein
MPPYPFAWRYTIREIRRPIRSLLTLIGIVLGVAALTEVAGRDGLWIQPNEDFSSMIHRVIVGG